MKYFKKLTGERVYLSPIDPTDAEIYTKWLNDSEITEFITLGSKIIGVEAEREALTQMARSGYNLSIVRLDDDAPLGVISLMSVDLVNRTAVLGIFIGEPSELSKGYGSEAIRLILDYGFNTLGLHGVKLDAYAFNERALACYRKVGFKEYGRRREATFKHGKYYDIICMDILENEFRELYNK